MSDGLDNRSLLPQSRANNLLGLQNWLRSSGSESEHDTNIVRARSESDGGGKLPDVTHASKSARERTHALIL